jgi:hypothetical protein
MDRRSASAGCQRAHHWDEGKARARWLPVALPADNATPWHLLRRCGPGLASSCSSRLDGPDRPATSAVLPASMNSAFHRPIDCSETFSFRAASAIDISPDKIANTIRVFFSGWIIGRSTHRLTSRSNADHALTTGLPESLKRSRTTEA